MLKIYGTMLCKDCVQCCQELDQSGVSYLFLEFNESLQYLKEFLSIRDHSELFSSVKENGAIGIPCLVDDDGSISLSWQRYVGQDNA